MTEKEHDLLWDALMTAEALIEDTLAIEAAGLVSGYKKGAAKSWSKANNKALNILQSREHND